MDVKTIWNEALEEIKKEINEFTFPLWFHDVEPLSLKGNTFELVTGTFAKAEILSNKHGQLIERVLRKVTNNPELEVKIIYSKAKDDQLTTAYTMDIQTIWKAALEEIKTQVSKPSFETWFKATKPISLEENTFVLAVPHAFAADWLMSRYGNLIEEVLQGVTGNPKIKFKAVYPKEGNEDEKTIHAESISTVDVLIKIENRMARIEEKLDKLLEVLSVNIKSEKS